jgi:glycyl-tRNA synthetase
MCKDPAKGEYIRADHLVEAVLEARLVADKKARGVSDGSKSESQSSQGKRKVVAKEVQTAKLEDSVVAEYEDILAQIDNYDGEQLGELIKRLEIRNPDGNGEVLPPIPFNLMFKSTIGPSAAAPVYLRPETAQGQFLNFRKLLEYNQNAMPFASASVGKSYRNEISPRSGLLRVREFLMAEIEHYVDPESGKQHPKFDEVRQVELPLLDRDTQLSGNTTVKSMPIGQAVDQKVVNNETLGYFLARIQAFLLKIGVDPKKLRFRQHLPNEMAHYACDCWDAELLTSYGWIECVGCADRSAYDLTVHMRRTGEKLVVREARSEPLHITEWQAIPDKKALGKTFKRDAKLIEAALSGQDQESLASLAQELDLKGEIQLPVAGLSDGQPSAKLTKESIKIERISRVENVREYTPNVIEP